MTLRTMLASAFAVALAAFGAAHAQAAFPGQNGLLAYSSQITSRHPKASIYTISPSGTGRRRLTKGRSAENPAWSADGTMIAYDQRRTARAPAHVYVMKADGSGKHRIKTRREAHDPAWAPDGKHLVFESCDGESMCERSTIYRVALDGSGSKRIGTQGVDPVWSPDGRWIAYGGMDGRRCPALTLVRPSGARRHTIGPRAPDKIGACAGAASIDFSPDGERLVYVALKATAKDRIYNLTMYTIRTDGSGRNELSSRPIEDGGYYTTPFVYSPDGQSLLWRDDRGAFIGDTNARNADKVAGADTAGVNYAWQSVPSR